MNWLGPESNRRHVDFQSTALPTELPSREWRNTASRRGLSLCRKGIVGQARARVISAGDAPALQSQSAIDCVAWISSYNPSMKRSISTSEAPGAIGPYSQGIRSGRFLFCSGQIPLDPKSGEIVSGDIATQTRQVMENIRGLLG